MFHQLIQDVFEERIPITPAEAVSTFTRVYACVCVSVQSCACTCVCVSVVVLFLCVYVCVL